MDYRKQLNEKQYEAVTTSSPYVRIIAGAGSGKTRVLTYRIAYLLHDLKAVPWKILAITFTNKVAREMKERVEHLLEDEPEVCQNLSILTFHSFGARFLRREIHHLHYSSSFTIVDEEDQEKLIKDIVSRDFMKNKSDPIVKKAIAYIGHQKTLGLYPEDVNIRKESFPDEKLCLEIYQHYEARLQQTGNLDFDDLLLKTIKILEHFPEVQEAWQKRIDHILIDEFQDTNDVQYRLIQLLKKPSASLYVVGDPDQTIYTWRGANQDIILDVDKRYQMETIVLDRNYRSTKTILQTANRLIACNRKRVKKDLFTENDTGEPVRIFSCYLAEEEAQWTIQQIQELASEKRRANEPFSYREVVILYRSSYLTLPFEKALVRAQIPYRIYGGLRFYQRREVKDLLAYFQLLVNPRNDSAFLRIINVPKRGFGERSIAMLRNEAEAKGLALYEYVLTWNPLESELRPRITQTLVTMVERLEKTRQQLAEGLEAYPAILADLINELGYETYLLEEDDDGKERCENVRSLLDDVLQFYKRNPDLSFAQYLENVSLQSAQDDIVEGDFVTLMTIHTAKGLEFPYVFLVGLNEGVFPSVRTMEENPLLGLEEERRLCYVAFTRAMKRLSLSCNREFSFIIGGRKIPSRFFKEAGLFFNRPEAPSLTPTFTKKPSTIQRAQAVGQNDVADWHKGDLVNHTVFGDGVVLDVIDQTILTIAFQKQGTKSILASHPSLTRKKKGGFDA